MTLPNVHYKIQGFHPEIKISEWIHPNRCGRELSTNWDDICRQGITGCINVPVEQNKK
jgi:hypothetical protein